MSLSQSVVPVALKSAKITPILKSKSNLSLSGFRPISVLPVLSKILEGLSMIN